MIKAWTFTLALETLKGIEFLSLIWPIQQKNRAKLYQMVLEMMAASFIVDQYLLKGTSHQSSTRCQSQQMYTIYNPKK